jgi:hypothetical protein
MLGNCYGFVKTAFARYFFACDGHAGLNKMFGG